MSECLFCDDFVGEVNGDGGSKGFRIGKRDICKACLEELKYRLSQVEEKSPIEREIIEENANEIEPTTNEDTQGTEEKDPFKA